MSSVFAPDLFVALRRARKKNAESSSGTRLRLPLAHHTKSAHDATTSSTWAQNPRAAHFVAATPRSPCPARVFPGRAPWTTRASKTYFEIRSVFSLAFVAASRSARRPRRSFSRRPRSRRRLPPRARRLSPRPWPRSARSARTRTRSRARVTTGSPRASPEPPPAARGRRREASRGRNVSRSRGFSFSFRSTRYARVARTPTEPLRTPRRLRFRRPTRASFPSPGSAPGCSCSWPRRCTGAGPSLRFRGRARRARCRTCSRRSCRRRTCSSG
mmetsp:Transcript_9664/g.41011  ORF Transcript_9664/g.41011 Transcript_9664/m.41011 type:complete len:272 (-) Transcript_9664:1465-2280(-)